MRSMNMRNTAIIILLAIFVMAVVYTVTNQAPAKPPIPAPLPLSIPFTQPPISLPPLPLNLTNASFLTGSS